MSNDRSFNVHNQGDNDIKISFIDYHFMLDDLRDDRFSPEMLLKFKHLFQNKMENLSLALKTTIPWAILGTYLIGTRAKRSHSGYA